MKIPRFLSTNSPSNQSSFAFGAQADAKAIGLELANWVGSNNDQNGLQTQLNYIINNAGLFTTQTVQRANVLLNYRNDPNAEVFIFAPNPLSLLVNVTTIGVADMGGPPSLYRVVTQANLFNVALGITVYN